MHFSLSVNWLSIIIWIQVRIYYDAVILTVDEKSTKARIILIFKYFKGYHLKELYFNLA